MEAGAFGGASALRRCFRSLSGREWTGAREVVRWGMQLLEEYLNRPAAVLPLLLTLTACTAGGRVLPPADDAANKHFVEAMRQRNEFVQWMNKLPSSPTEQKPSVDEWEAALSHLDVAIREAESVDSGFLTRAHGDLPAMWQGFFIPSIRKAHDYYALGVTDSIELPSTEPGMQQLNLLLDSKKLDALWGAWYDTHREAIRAGIREMSHPR